MQQQNIPRETVREWLRQEKANLLIEANQVCNAFMAAQRSARRDPNKTQHPYIGSRVRLVRSSISCECFRYVPKTTSKGEKILTSTYIKINRATQACNMRHFRNEPAWAQQLILMSDTQYQKIRMRFQTLNNIERLLKKLSTDI